MQRQVGLYEPWRGHLLHVVQRAVDAVVEGPFLQQFVIIVYFIILRLCLSTFNFSGGSMLGSSSDCISTNG